MSLADREHLPKVVTDVDGIRDILLALDPEIVLLREDISQLIKELYVSTTEKYIDRWEQDFSLPYDGSLTLEQRRQRIKNKLARKKVLNWENLRLLIKNNVVKPKFYIVNEAENYHFKIFLEQQPQRQEFDLSKFTVVGSPTIVDGVASGFSQDNGITTTINYLKCFKIRAKGIFSETPNTSSSGKPFSLFGIHGGIGIDIHTGMVGVPRATVTGAIYTPIKEGDVVEVELEQTEQNITLKAWINGVLHEKTWASTAKEYTNSTLCIGAAGKNSSYYWTGSIDLKQFSITVDGKEVFSGIKNIDYITNELRTSLKQAKPAYLTFDLIVTEFFTRYCGTFSSGTEPL